MLANQKLVVNMEDVELKVENEQLENIVKCESDESVYQQESLVTTSEPQIVWQFEDIVVKKEPLNIHEPNEDEQLPTSVKCESVETSDMPVKEEYLNIHEMKTEQVCLSC